jgi:hypothetical protein
MSGPAPATNNACKQAFNYFSKGPGLFMAASAITGLVLLIIGILGQHDILTINEPGRIALLSLGASLLTVALFCLGFDKTPANWAITFFVAYLIFVIASITLGSLGVEQVGSLKTMGKPVSVALITAGCSVFASILLGFLLSAASDSSTFSYRKIWGTPPRPTQAPPPPATNTSSGATSTTTTGNT